MAGDNARDERIRRKAFQTWLAEGRPLGRERELWDTARLAIARHDALLCMLKPGKPPGPELLEAIKNQAEFAELLDHEESAAPGVNSGQAKNP